MAFNLDGYVDVATRLRLALDRWPELRVQEQTPQLTPDGRFVSVTVHVWRTVDDPLPSIATAWEPAVGKTSYTKDSEMMNAGTSALGRALGYMGIGIERSISSTNETANRVHDTAAATTPPRPSHPRGSRPPAGEAPFIEPDQAQAIARPISEKQAGLIQRMCAERGEDIPDNLGEYTAAQASAFIDHLKTLEVIR